jgi:DNA-binding MarR family transcriptional regulator
MAPQRLSRLHKQLLRWFAADHYRSKGFISSSHEELGKALQRDKGTISRSLRTLETHGWIIVGRSAGGKAQYVRLTSAGHQKAAEIAEKVGVKKQA